MSEGVLLKMDSKENANDISVHKSFTEKVKKFKKSIDMEIESEIDLESDTNAEDEVAETEAAVDKLKEELEEAKKLSVDYLDKLRRNMAEFDNFRKRTAKEKAGMYDEGVSDSFEKLIPVLDNFELALNAAANKEDNFYKGVEMICKQLQTVMLDSGVEEIQALGCKFDPNLHNAVVHTTDPAFGENEIIEEMRKGYKYKEKVLRYSMVKVAN